VCGPSIASRLRSSVSGRPISPSRAGSENALGTITVGRENSTSIDVYYEDHGAGSGVVLLSGFPLRGDSWEKQIDDALLREGHRVITYDRRGFGRSSQPSTGYDFDTLASDLNTLMTTLDLQQAVLVGHSAGTGEIVRFLSAYGSRRVTTAVLIAPLQPFLLKTIDNPQGVEASIFKRMLDKIALDRAAFLADFVAESYNTTWRFPNGVSERLLHYHWLAGLNASPIGTAECLAAWLTDFRADLCLIDIPVLVISGGRDRLLPFAATGGRLSMLHPRLQSIAFRRCSARLGLDARRSREQRYPRLHRPIARPSAWRVAVCSVRIDRLPRNETVVPASGQLRVLQTHYAQGPQRYE
jgi:non-heme chloroperoxidase